MGIIQHAYKPAQEQSKESLHNSSEVRGEGRIWIQDFLELSSSQDPTLLLSMDVLMPKKLRVGNGTVISRTHLPLTPLPVSTHWLPLYSYCEVNILYSHITGEKQRSQTLLSIQHSYELSPIIQSPRLWPWPLHLLSPDEQAGGKGHCTCPDMKFVQQACFYQEAY